MSQTKTSDLMPSQAEAFVFDGVATRILMERNRVGLSQEEFAKLGGASQPTQGRYEAGSPPKISYLAALAANGIDVIFILTGKRSDGAQAVAALMPSQAERYNSLSLGQRLRAERKRIGATQATEELRRRQDEMEAAMKLLSTSNSQLAARALAYHPRLFPLTRPDGSRRPQRYPKFWRHLDVRVRVVELCSQTTIDDALHRLRNEFGDRAPTRSPLGRFFKEFAPVLKSPNLVRPNQ